MYIRKACFSDAEKIAENNCFLAKESEGTDISFEVTLNGVKEIIKDKNKGFYLLIEEKNEVIGQLLITYEYSDWKNKNMWWLQSVYIKNEYRKKGFFKALFEEVKNIAKNNKIEILRLYVYKKNKSAIEVYKKIGMIKKEYLIFESKLIN
jgi:ribosomal protein S18 acetylase RimI-like enzyme